MTCFLASTMIAVSIIGMPVQPLRWESDYGKALEVTREHHRPLLIVLDIPADTENRIEPARLSQETTSGGAADLLAPYQLCHVDVSTEYGKRVAKAFRAKSFPYVAIIDKAGEKIIFKQKGKITSAQWRKALVTHKKGNVPVVVYKPIQADTVSTNSAYGVNSSFQQSFDPNYCPSCQQGW